MFRIFAAATALLVTLGCQEVEPTVQPAAEPAASPVEASVELVDEPSTDEVADPCGALEPGAHTLVVPGFEDRLVRVHVPEGEGVRDAVVMLHGAGENGAIARNVTRYAAEAGARGMVAVFPDAVDELWRAGSFDGFDIDQSVDDVAFLSALSDTLADQVCVDRVLAAGFSNGSMMVQRWACEGTGVDAVVGASGPRVEHACPQEPVPFLYAHGTADAVVSYDGSVGAVSGYELPSVASTLDQWLDHNGWDGQEPTVVENGPITCETFDGIEPVIGCSIDGWGHRWPGGIHTLLTPQRDLTRTSLDWFLAGAGA